MLRLLTVIILMLALVAGNVARAQDDAPTLGFERGGYWLVNPAPSDIALRNTDKNHDGSIRLALYRLTDPALLTQVMTARAARSLGEGELLRRVADGATPIWQGELVPDPTQPVMKLPLDILAGQDGQALGNGVYVVTATLADGNGNGSVDNNAHATQWFMRSAIDIATRFYGNHALVTVYDMATRQPRADMSLTWLDATGKTLGKTVPTDANGTAWLDRPQETAVLLMASAPDMDTAFAPVPAKTAATIDQALILPDNTQTGAGQPVSALVLAPGFNASGLKAKLAGQDMKLTPLSNALYKAEGTVPAAIPAGSVALELFHDDQLLARRLLAQSNNPDLTLDWKQKPASIVGAGKATYKFRLLQNGKPLADKAGSLLVSSAMTADSDSVPMVGAAPVTLPFTTDQKGEAVVTLDPVQLTWLTETAPAYAVLSVMLDDAPVGERVALSLYPARNWLEIIPAFADDAVAEGATARFTVRPGNTSGNVVAITAPLDWQLARETYKFEWYQADDGRWLYRTKTALAPVASGKASFGGKDNSATVAVPVGAGRYRLTVTADRLTASMGFTAGWWLAPVPTSTPERITLKAQMEQVADHGADSATDSAAGGKNNTSHMAVFVDPPFAARVWLTVTTAMGAHTVVQDVPDDGAFVYIDQADLPAGQPLTLNAFAVPSKPEATLAQALGSLTLPVGLPLTVTPEVVSAQQPTVLTISGLPASSKTMAQILDDGDAVLYATAPQDATDGALRINLPPLATGIDSDGALTLRLITTAGDAVSLTDKRLTNDGDIALEVPTMTAVAGNATLNVTVTARGGLKEKSRLTLIGGEATSVTVPPLVAGKPVIVRLPLGAQKPGQKDLLLRLESGKDKAPLAARPLRLLVK